MIINKIYAAYLKNPSVETDTRKLKHGDIFFALKGPNFNGNHFIEEALGVGAALIVCDEHQPVKDEKIIVVEDALAALQHLAAHHRNQFQIPFIAITGSNGKTTTKELMHKVLSSQFITYTTQGNLNNHIGVPLTILKIRTDAQMAIVEMGANHLDEIASYCKYTRPTHGLITNIGKAHLEGFGGAENVKKAKGELFDYLRINGGTVFVNADDANVMSLAEAIHEKRLYGLTAKDVSGKAQENGFFLQVEINRPGPFNIDTQLVGKYNLHNVLAAVCAGKYFGIANDNMKKSIAAYIPSNSRSQLLKRGNNEIILDAYNANPGSMTAAIENFATLKGDKKLLLLGDMKELGADSNAEHQAVVDLIKKYNWTGVALVGDIFASVNHEYEQFKNSDEAARWYREKDYRGYQILIKGSRSMMMEKVIEE